MYRVDIGGISGLIKSGGFFISRVGINGILILVEFSRIPGLVESYKSSYILNIL